MIAVILFSQRTNAAVKPHSLYIHLIYIYMRSCVMQKAISLLTCRRSLHRCIPVVKGSLLCAILQDNLRAYILQVLLKG